MGEKQDADLGIAAKVGAAQDRYGFQNIDTNSKLQVWFGSGSIRIDKRIGMCPAFPRLSISLIEYLRIVFYLNRWPASTHDYL